MRVRLGMRPSELLWRGRVRLNAERGGERGDMGREIWLKEEGNSVKRKCKGGACPMDGETGRTILCSKDRVKTNSLANWVVGENTDR